MNDGVISREVVHGEFERCQLKLNRYGLARALILAGLIQEGSVCEYASIDEHDGFFEASFRKESGTPP